VPEITVTAGQLRGLLALLNMRDPQAHVTLKVPPAESDFVVSFVEQLAQGERSCLMTVSAIPRTGERIHIDDNYPIGPSAIPVQGIKPPVPARELGWAGAWTVVQVDHYMTRFGDEPRIHLIEVWVKRAGGE
jgi:hypothetical protein